MAHIPQKLHPWIEARKRHHLSHAHVQMARELGMNPKKLGKLDNHRQEPWKLPLPQFIERLYRRRFRRERPETVRSIEEIARMKDTQHAAKKEAKQKRREPPPQALLSWTFERSIPTEDFLAEYDLTEPGNLEEVVENFHT